MKHSNQRHISTIEFPIKSYHSPFYNSTPKSQTFYFWGNKEISEMYPNKFQDELCTAARGLPCVAITNNGLLLCARLIGILRDVVFILVGVVRVRVGFGRFLFLFLLLN